MAKPKSSEIIVGLDIGTTKIACIVGEVTLSATCLPYSEPKMAAAAALTVLWAPG